jgi:glycosyltransferase involved in cell wall biosynthesis
VASAIEGIVEQVDHAREAVLVPPGQPAALTPALVSLLEDPALARRLAAAARRRAVTAFDVSQALAATRQIYTELARGAVSGHPPGR